MNAFVNHHPENMPLKSQVDLQLYHYGYQACDANHSWGPGIKDHYKIHLIFKGSGFYRLGEKTFSLGAGNAFLTTPDTIAYYKADAETPWEYAWFAFDGLNAHSYLSRSGLSTEAPVCNLSPDQLIEARQLIQHMIEMPSTAPGKDLLLLSKLYQLLALMVKTSGLTSGSSPSKVSGTRERAEAPVLPAMAEVYMKAALNYISMNYTRHMTCEEMADRIGIHRKYLAKLFNMALGTSPQAYLIAFRMEKAKQLLLHTTLTVAETAVSVGYEDSAAYSKAFKKYTGDSPTHFRQL